MEGDHSENYLEINPQLRIPLAEIHISFSRSGGPGGQHVNKTSTQAELTFDLVHSNSISEEDRTWLMERLATKLDTSGILRITAQEFRSQLRNRNAALEKLRMLLQEALIRPKKRRKVKPSRAAREARLQSKKIASDKKRLRSERF